MVATLLNRNEVLQGPSPECLTVLANFSSRKASRYIDGYYSSQLRDELCRKFSLPAKQIVVDYGGEQILRTIFGSLMPGLDTALTTEARYSYYDKYLSFLKVRLESFKLIVEKGQFVFDIDDCLQKSRDLRPKLILITSPNNPTGNSISAAQMKRILSNAAEDTLVVLDEAYIGFDPEYDEAAFLSLLVEHPNLLILRTFSKLYALAGLRIGFALCGANVKKMLHYQDLYLGGSRVLEEVAIAALNSFQYYQTIAKAIIADREFFIDTLAGYQHFKPYKSKANFVAVRVSEPAKIALEAKLASESYIISKFVDESLMRVSIGMHEYTKPVANILAAIENSLS